METAHDSIKYIKPVYSKTYSSIYDGNDNYKLKLDDDNNLGKVMYESVESRYATQLIEGTCTLSGLVITAEFKTPFIPGDAQVIMDGQVIAAQIREAKGAAHGEFTWMLSDVLDATKTTKVADNKWTFELKAAPAGTPVLKAIGRMDTDMDLKGEYLGEVELQVSDYVFKPYPIALGVTWTQLAELTLDTSFGVSAEEMLMDSASQEIKKTLDFQAIKLAIKGQKMFSPETKVVFNAEAGSTTKDSYYHTAQLVDQAISRVGDIQLNKILRGGVTAIVGGPAAVSYLKLNEGFKAVGIQPAIGAHKMGEINGIPVFKCPSSIVDDDKMLTVWKNPVTTNDVALAIGTLMPFYSTGVQQRKNFFKEAGIARYEDSKLLNPGYLGQIHVLNIREINGENG